MSDEISHLKARVDWLTRSLRRVAARHNEVLDPEPEKPKIDTSKAVTSDDVAIWLDKLADEYAVAADIASKHEEFRFSDHKQSGSMALRAAASSLRVRYSMKLSKIDEQLNEIQRGVTMTAVASDDGSGHVTVKVEKLALATKDIADAVARETEATLKKSNMTLRCAHDPYACPDDICPCECSMCVQPGDDSRPPYPKSVSVTATDPVEKCIECGEHRDDTVTIFIDNYIGQLCAGCASAIVREREETPRQRKDRVAVYCKALDTWARTTNQIERRILADVRMRLTKSCLAKRLVYMGEPLRTRKCPIHDGEWSGCYAERCPAGCDTCGCCCGWIPEDNDVLEGLGWTFWLSAAIDEKIVLPGCAKQYGMRAERDEVTK